jgi:hypothetical protein
LAKSNAPDIDTVYNDYQAGINYKNTINLYNTTERNERFYAGDQWSGSNSPDLPKPVINFIGRACDQKIAQLTQNNASIVFTAPDWPADVVTPEVAQQQNEKTAQTIAGNKPVDILESEADCNKLSGMFEIDWDRLNMDSISQNGLLDACISGDFILFNYWDAEAETGQDAKGHINVETIDNVNYYPGNVNEVDSQKQPYIIIARREMVNDVKAEAKANGAKPDDLDMIHNDMNYMWQSGDMAHYELRDNEDGKTITLLYLWRNRDTGTIWAQKSVKNMVIRPAWDIKTKRYPIALMNWKLRKNSCHGRAEITGLIPNQVAINKILAIIILYMLRNGSPKVIYSRSAGIQKWDNSLTKPIAVNGDVNAAAKYLPVASMAADAYSLPTTLLNMTEQMMGANDVAMGTVSYRNAYAQLLAKLQQEAPARTIRNRYYNLIRDFALNWLDMTLAYYKTSRWVQIVDNVGNKYITDFDPEKARGKIWNIDINIGEAPEWSESVILEQLGNALQTGAIDFPTYLQLMPEDYFPNKEDILQKFMARQQQQAQMSGNGKKPPSVSINLKDLPPDGQMQAAQEAGIQLNPQDYQQQPQQPQIGQQPQQGQQIPSQLLQQITGGR